jgi:hypothetical protein
VTAALAPLHRSLKTVSRHDPIEPSGLRQYPPQKNAAPQSENVLLPEMAMFLSPCASAELPLARVAVAIAPARRILALRQLVPCVSFFIDLPSSEMVRTSQARLAQWWWYLTGRIPRAKPDIRRG